MAEYSLTPYLFSVSPRYNRDDQLRMGNIITSPRLSAADVVSNTLLSLEREAEPRNFGLRGSRYLSGGEVLRSGEQVLFRLNVGISGFSSTMNFVETEKIERRNPSDFEWFSLRVLFISDRESRKALILSERVANYSAFSAISDILKRAVTKYASGTTDICPVQNLSVLQEDLEDIKIKSIEFRAPAQSKNIDIADQVSGDHFGKPLEGLKVKQPALKKITKYVRRGGLGKFGSFKGKSLKELSECFGYIPDDPENTEVAATVVGDDGKLRTVSLGEEKTRAVSFAIEREDQNAVPTDEEFFKTASRVFSCTKDLLAVSELNIKPKDSFHAVTELKGFEEWELNGENA